MMHLSFILALRWCGDICSPSPQGAALGWTQPGFNPVSPTTGAGSVSSLVRICNPLLGKDLDFWFLLNRITNPELLRRGLQIRVSGGYYVLAAIYHRHRTLSTMVVEDRLMNL